MVRAAAPGVRGAGLQEALVLGVGQLLGQRRVVLPQPARGQGGGHWERTGEWRRGESAATPTWEERLRGPQLWWGE